LGTEFTNWITKNITFSQKSTKNYPATTAATTDMEGSPGTVSPLEEQNFEISGVQAGQQ
jgi:hypothetical protein